MCLFLLFFLVYIFLQPTDDYLRFMLRELETAESSAPRLPVSESAGGHCPACVKLSEWHMVNAADCAFGWLNPKTDSGKGEEYKYTYICIPLFDMYMYTFIFDV